MTWDFSKTLLVTARKDYPCEACEWLVNSIDHGELTFSELRQVALAKRDGYKIKKGQTYVRVKGKWEGEFAIFRARPAIDDICRKHSIYQE
jgi:hypothetical protein